MAICKFYQQGGCRFGNRCYNEHVDPQRSNYSPPQRHGNQRQQSGAGFSFTRALEQVTKTDQPEHRRNVQFDESRNQYHGSNRQVSQNQRSFNQPSSSGFSFSKTFNQIQQQQPSLFGQRDIDMGSEMSGSTSSMFQSFSGTQSQSMFPSHQIQPESMFVSPAHEPSLLQSASNTIMSTTFNSMNESIDGTSTQPVTQTVTSNSTGNVVTEYSLLSDLSAEELDAFKAECFSFGKIPFKPPPLQLCK